MLICELIECLRRFPQNAKVYAWNGEIVVETDHGDFAADCPTSALPEEWRIATERSAES